MRAEIELGSREPAIDGLFLAEDEFERLLRGRPLHHQHIPRLPRQGNNYREIAGTMGLHERTVRRLGAHLRSALPSQAASEPHPLKGHRQG